MNKMGEDFAPFVWNLVGERPMRTPEPHPTQTPLSMEIFRELKKRGFKFVGPVIVYAWMEAVGMVDNHVNVCHKHMQHRIITRGLNGPQRLHL